MKTKLCYFRNLPGSSCAKTQESGWKPLNLRTTLFFIFLLSLSDSFSQHLHHQMISAQGTTKKTVSGLVVQQTIGQQTTTGNHSDGIVVQQGFEQTFWNTHIAKNETSIVSVVPFPNPFVEGLNFQFSTSIDAAVSVMIFDVSGRLVFTKEQAVVGNLLTLDLSGLAAAEYLVQLRSSQFHLFTKILKI